MPGPAAAQTRQAQPAPVEARTRRAPEGRQALRSLVYPTRARPARSRQAPAALMVTAKQGRPMTARRWAARRVAQQAAHPNRRPRGTLARAPPTKARPEPRALSALPERTPVAADPMPAPALRARPRTGRVPGQAPVRQGAAGRRPARRRARPRSDPARLRWKAAQPVRPMTAMRPVTKLREMRAHPRCPRSGWPLELPRPNPAKVKQRWSARRGWGWEAAPTLQPRRRSGSMVRPAGPAAPTSSFACDASSDRGKPHRGRPPPG
jgi:hypothetical protein